MNSSRRKFLKLAGMAALGITAGKYEKIFGLTGYSNTQHSQSVSKLRAMVIDIRKCLVEKGCTACISSCNKTHNVPNIDNTKHEIKWIWKEDYENVFLEKENHFLNEDFKHSEILILCNHCDNPPCVKVCPTKATWKREDGIVMMDWHRCIGCRYCMAACPYGSRSFNWISPRPFIENITKNFPTRTKGVVEKCTFCDERLARNQLPACVEACPQKCLLFGDLNDSKSEVRQVLANNFSIRRKPSLGTNPKIYYIV